MPEEAAESILGRLREHLGDRGEQVELLGGILIGGGVFAFGAAEGDMELVLAGGSIMWLAMATDATLDDILGKLP